MSDLVRRLSEHDTEVVLDGVDEPLSLVRRRIEELGHVTVRFTETAGGTTLGVSVDPEVTAFRVPGAGSEAESLHLEGTLTLDFVPVRCVADIDLASRRGTGRLLPRQPDQGQS